MQRLAAFCEAHGGDGRPVRLRFRTLAPCTARELLAGLGLSKPVVGRVFAAAQLVRASNPNHPLNPHDRLSADDELFLCTRVTREDVPADATPLEPLYEDPFVMAVEKPAGLLVHGDGTGAPTLTARVRGHLACAGNPAVPQAVQRLDVDTTGVVLFSKTEEFQGLFDALVADGGMGKCYLAVVAGPYPQERAVLHGPLARDRHDARRMRVARPGEGQDARTEVERLAVAPDGRHSLLWVRLGTGRKHQIRVHLSHQGFPIANDPLYGTVETGAGLMLHAWEERFDHPVTGGEVRVRAAWPARFGAWFSPDDLGSELADPAAFETARAAAAKEERRAAHGPAR